LCSFLFDGEAGEGDHEDQAHPSDRWRNEEGLEAVHVEHGKNDGEEGEGDRHPDESLGLVVNISHKSESHCRKLEGAQRRGDVALDADRRGSQALLYHEMKLQHG